MEFWKQLSLEISKGNSCILMYVIQSEGSSPGRQGFKMFVSDSGFMFGSIGGGFMEHKWVEFCKSKLGETEFRPFIKRQIHQKEAKENKSGLICSGEQTIAFYPLNKSDVVLIDLISNAIDSEKYANIVFDSKSIQYSQSANIAGKFQLEITENQSNWSLTENLGYFSNLYIAGGGHVGLALTKIAHQLGFKVFTFDNRKNLNTVENNPIAKHTYVSDYSKLNDYIPSGDNSFVVLMSFGYITDKIILKSLLPNSFKYLGMMGSQEKVNQLFEELKNEGLTEEILDKVHSPIGIQIHSKTPEEIAISILAEIVLIKNSN